jgi:hypothetical protein
VTDAKLERSCALVGGLVFVATVLASVLIVGGPPGLDDDPVEFGNYFRDNDAAIKIAAYLTGVGAIAALFWLGSLWRAMRRAERGDPLLTIVAAFGLGLAGSAALASSAINSAVAFRVDDVADPAAKYSFTESYVLGSMTAFGIAALVGAVSLLALRTGFLPSWLGSAGLALAIAFVFAGGAVADDTDAMAVIGFIVFLLWLVWFVIVSVLLARKSAAA